MIEDLELRNLFRTESEERLQHLDRGLLQLEQDPQNQGILEELFREVHSLKGEARMLGLADIEAIAHRFESLLGGARKGDFALTSAIAERLHQALEAIRQLAGQAVSGEPAGVVVSEVLAQIGAAGSDGDRKKAGLAAQPAAVLPTPGASEAPERGQASPSPKAAVPSLAADQEAGGIGEGGEGTVPGPTSRTGGTTGKFRIETIRVATEKLDALMTHVGELNVTKNRVAHGLDRIGEVIALWERLSGGGLQLRSLLQEMATSHHNGFHRRLVEYYHQEAALLERLGSLLSEVRNFASEDSSKLDYVANELESGVRSLRLLPLSTIVNLFPRMVRDLAGSQGKEVRLLIEGEESTADKGIIEEMKDPLMHLIRNAIDHGIEPPEERQRLGKPRVGTIRLKAGQNASNLVLEVADDGRGLDLEAIRSAALKKKLASPESLRGMGPAEICDLVFRSGFTTRTFVSDVSGRGVGLDVVRANVERLKGAIHLDSLPGQGCTFRVQLPLTMATARVLTVALSGRKYALPVESVEAIKLVSLREVFPMEGQATLVLDNRPVSVAWLAELLELRGSGPGEFRGFFGSGAAIPCVLLALGGERLGLLVDQLLDEQEIVLKPQSKLLRRVRNVSGATILGTGEVCILLNPQDLIKSARRREAANPRDLSAAEGGEKKLILMSEDSITTRTQLQRILEGEGYEVVTAVDGLEAYNKIGTRSFDALVSDIQMPNMTGLDLTEKLRKDSRYRELPIILVSSLASEEDRRRGLEAGANAYITKPAFDQKVLLDTLRSLI